MASKHSHTRPQAHPSRLEGWLAWSKVQPCRLEYSLHGSKQSIHGSLHSLQGFRQGRSGSAYHLHKRGPKFTFQTLSNAFKAAIQLCTPAVRVQISSSKRQVPTSKYQSSTICMAPPDYSLRGSENRRQTRRAGPSAFADPPDPLSGPIVQDQAFMASRSAIKKPNIQPLRPHVPPYCP